MTAGLITSSRHAADELLSERRAAWRAFFAVLWRSARGIWGVGVGMMVAWVIAGWSDVARHRVDYVTLMIGLAIGLSAIRQEREEVFILSRPMPLGCYLGGRLAASIGGAAALVALAAALPWSEPAARPSVSDLLAGALRFAVPLSLIIAAVEAVRARAWGAALALGVAFVSLGAVVVFAIGNGSARWLVSSYVGTIALGLGALALIILPPSVGLARGRTDGVRRARWAALVWWCALFPLALGAWWWSGRPAASFRDALLLEVAVPSGNGMAAHVTGFVPGAARVGALVGEIGYDPISASRFAFSADGQHAAWLEHDAGRWRTTFHLVVAEWSPAGALNQRVRVEVPARTAAYVESMQFSRDGTRLLLVTGAFLQVRDAVTGADYGEIDRHQVQPAASAYLDGDGRRTAGPSWGYRLTPIAFPDAQQLVLVRAAATGSFDARDAEVVEVATSTGGVRVLLRIADLDPPAAHGGHVTLTPDGTQVIVVRRSRASEVAPAEAGAHEGVRRYDDAGGFSITVYALPGGEELARAAVPSGQHSLGRLSDGRLLIVTRASSGKVLLTSLLSGVRSAPTVLDGGHNGVVLGAEVRPGIVAVGLKGRTPAETETLLIDVASGATVERLRGVVPLLRTRFPYEEDAWRLAAPVQRFFEGEQGVLVIDPDSLRMRRVLDLPAAK